MKPVYGDADWKRAQERVKLCKSASELKGVLRSEASVMATKIEELEMHANRRLPHKSFWKKLDVKLIERESSHSGGHLETDSARIIFIRASENGFRKRFTAAHEAAHLFLDHFIARHPNALSRVEEESVCDEFASSLLIPSRKLDGLLDEYDQLTLEVIHSISRAFRVNLLPAVIAISQTDRFSQDISFLAKRVGHPSRPNEIDYRIKCAPHRSIFFLPTNKRIKSLGLGDVCEALSDASPGTIRRGEAEDVCIPLWCRRRGSGTASGLLTWQAQLLGSGEIFALLHTQELKRQWNPPKKMRRV